MNDAISPTSSIRRRAWIFLGIGAVLFVLVAPMFWVAGGTDQEGNGGIYTAISWVALILGASGLVAGVATMGKARRIARQNLEATQRAALAQANERVW